jgi:hypothetical protein
VVELALLHGQTDFDVAQALAIGQLGERHGEELIPTGQAADAVIAVVPGYAPVELVVRQELGDLRQDGVSVVHRDSTPELIGGEYGTQTALQISNRLNPFCHIRVGL